MKKNRFNTLNEEINRMKSLFGESRLYGNLIDEDKKVLSEQWKFFKRASDAFSLSLKRLKSIPNIKYLDEFLNVELNSLDDVIKHIRNTNYRPIWDIVGGTTIWDDVANTLDDFNQMKKKGYWEGLHPDVQMALLDGLPEIGSVKQITTEMMGVNSKQLGTGGDITIRNNDLVVGNTKTGELVVGTKNTDGVTIWKDKNGKVIDDTDVSYRSDVKDTDVNVKGDDLDAEDAIEVIELENGKTIYKDQNGVYKDEYNQLVDAEGNRIDVDGEKLEVIYDSGIEKIYRDKNGVLTNQKGHTIDSRGNRIDADGNRIDDEGFLIDVNGVRRYPDGTRVDESIPELEVPENSNLDDINNYQVPGTTENIDNIGEAIENTAETVKAEGGQILISVEWKGEGGKEVAEEVVGRMTGGGKTTPVDPNNVDNLIPSGGGGGGGQTPEMKKAFKEKVKDRVAQFLSHPVGKYVNVFTLGENWAFKRMGKDAPFGGNLKSIFQRRVPAGILRFLVLNTVHTTVRTALTDERSFWNGFDDNWFIDWWGDFIGVVTFWLPDDKDLATMSLALLRETVLKLTDNKCDLKIEFESALIKGKNQLRYIGTDDKDSSGNRYSIISCEDVVDKTPADILKLCIDIPMSEQYTIITKKYQNIFSDTAKYKKFEKAVKYFYEKTRDGVAGDSEWVVMAKRKKEQCEELLDTKAHELEVQSKEYTIEFTTEEGAGGY